MVRALASHSCVPGSIPARCNMWVEFVARFLLAPRVLLWVLWFSSLHNNQHLQILIRPGKETCIKPAKADVASSIVIYFYLSF